MYQIYKIFIYIPWLALWTVCNFLGVVVVAPFSPRRAGRWFGRLWGRGLMYGVPARTVVSGGEQISPRDSYVLVANHLSLMDIPLLYGWLPLDFIWIMKKEVRRIPIIGISSAMLGHVFIDRSNHEAALRELRQLRDTLPPGASILFFPEGTRSRDSELHAFKMGAFNMARELQLPIVPISLVGTNRILSPDGTDLHPGAARLIIHPPITAEEVCAASAEELRDRARAVISSSLG